MSTLRIDNLNQFYGGSHILWDLSLDVQPGDCACIMGRNGVGKTTLLKVIMGLIPARSGDIHFQQTDLLKQNASDRARLGIGYVPQGREIFSQLTVQENLEIGLTTGRSRHSHIPESIYELFPVLREMLHRRGGDLSGGQQQQLAIARALVLEPSLLILDEPTEGIQPNIVKQIGDVITRLNREQNMTVLLVEQKLSFARRVARSFSILEKGSVVASDQIENLSDSLVKQYLSV